MYTPQREELTENLSIVCQEYGTLPIFIYDHQLSKQKSGIKEILK